MPIQTDFCVLIGSSRLSTCNLFADIVLYIAAFCIFSGLVCKLAHATRLENKHIIV